MVIDEYRRALFHIQIVAPEPIDMVGQVGTECRHLLQRITVSLKIMQHLTEREDVVEDNAGGHQMVVLYDLALLIPVVPGPNHSWKRKWRNFEGIVVNPLKYPVTFN